MAPVAVHPRPAAAMLDEIGSVHIIWAVIHRYDKPGRWGRFDDNRSARCRAEHYPEQDDDRFIHNILPVGAGRPAPLEQNRFWAGRWTHFVPGGGGGGPGGSPKW